MFMHVRMSVCTRVCRCPCACVRGEGRGSCQVSCSTILPFFTQTGLSLVSELDNVAAPAIQLTPVRLGLQAIALLGFYVGSGDPNPGPQACRDSTSSTEPSLQPPLYLFLNSPPRTHRPRWLAVVWPPGCVCLSLEEQGSPCTS